MVLAVLAVLFCGYVVEISTVLSREKMTEDRPRISQSWVFTWGRSQPSGYVDLSDDLSVDLTS